MSRPPPRILIIAGSDSSGGAGIQADIKTVTMLGGYAMTAITALTAQNSIGVQAVQSADPDFVAAQIHSCVSDIGIDAIKIGMLGSPEVAHRVAACVERLDVPIVFDPVMIATSGSVLADADTIAAFGRLMRTATLTTPNLPELEALGGIEAVQEVTRNVLVKGGHGTGAIIEDTLHAENGTHTYSTERIATGHTHGTGCTLASAIATGLGGGLSLSDATERGIRFVEMALKNAPGFGEGHGPVGHTLGFTPFYQRLAMLDPDGFDAEAWAARWGDA